jgi:6-phosphogluconolactonase
VASGLTLRIFPDPQSVAREAAARIHSLIVAKTAGGGFSLALSGGNTPRLLYQRLAEDYRDRIPWARVHIYWSDERYVPHDDPRSNYRTARETLLDHVPVPPACVHPMPTDAADPDQAARRYERVLPPSFDLVLLGMGSDGHTASLFPGSSALDETRRRVVASEAPVEPRVRLTLTLPALNGAEAVFFLVTGADKAPAVRRIAMESPDPRACPAAGVRPRRGAVVWWVDAAAASALR